MRHLPQLARFALLSLSLLGAAEPVLPGNRAPVGGGTTAAGFRGEYFANPGFAGAPAFVRRDVRISHDWLEGAAGPGLPVGGASTPGLAGFPRDDFSIRWTGRVVPRFSEGYAFRVTGRDGVRFTCAGKVLVDSLGAGTVQEASAGALEAGKAYDVVFEYVDRAGTGASAARLEWSSPSTPWEVVEPLSFAQICGHQASPGQWLSNERADRKRESNEWKDLRGLGDKDYRGAKELGGADLDADGWPLVPDALVAINHDQRGRYQVRFTGRANIEIGSLWNTATPLAWLTGVDAAGQGTAVAPGKGRFGRALLPKGAGYDERANTTTAWFDLQEPLTGMALFITDAEREPGKPGIAGLQVLVPVAEGARETHQPGEILKREARKTFENFIVNRLHIGMSQNKGSTWAERTMPSYQAREHALGWGYCLEEYIQLVNESGMDWHLCFGAGWDEDYMRKFARLVRYGSDGVEPYDRYVADPKYPPLNPNLRLYLEHSNELPWAVYPGFIWDDLRRKAAEGHPDWKIVNYDGKCQGADGTAMFRYHALRMRQMSEAFRLVHADVPGAMGDRARVLCFGQYDAAHVNTMLQFLDNYFNKADPASTFAGEPHPPSHALWGGGGAIYYGCSNKFGLQEREPIANAGFEDVRLDDAAAVLRPADAGWTFAGDAGICSVRLPAREGVALAQPPTEPAEPLKSERWVGMKFTVGERNLYVSQMGRWVGKAHTDANFWKSPNLRLAIFPADPKTGGAGAEIRSAPRLATFAGDTFAYEWCAGRAGGQDKALPALLLAGQSYYLVSREKAGDQANRFFGPVPVTAAAGLTIAAAASSADGKAWDEIPGSHAFGPVNLRFSDRPVAAGETEIGVPPDASEIRFVAPWSKDGRGPEFDFGRQCAFIRGDGGFSREFTVEKAGAYWITLSTALDRLSNRFHREGWGGWVVHQGGGTLRVRIDGQDVTPRPLPIGGFESRFEPFHYSATRVFRLEPGTHTVAFERTKSGGGTMFIDAIHLSSEDAFYGGPASPNFPAGGNAFGQNAATGYHKTAQAECEMARNWGLVPMTYEGGWAVQGDFDHYSMLAWEDLRYGSPATNPELTKQALRNAFDIWCRNGGYIYAYFYPVQRNCAQVDAPLLACVREFNDRLPAAPEAGTPIPGVLGPDQPHTQNDKDGRYVPTWGKRPGPAVPAHGWKSWIVTSRESADYAIVATASGGPAVLRVDGVAVAAGNAAGGLNAVVRLTAGVHAVRLEAREQALKVETVRIDKR